MPNRALARRFLAAAALAAMAACANPSTTELSRPELVLMDGGTGTTRMDHAEIESARIEGDVLHLRAVFGGGCAEHQFALLHTGVWMESLPVQTSLYLAHDANGDNCRALLSRDLSFDLTPLKKTYHAAYGSRGPLVVHLYAPRAATPYQPALRYQF